MLHTGVAILAVTQSHTGGIHLHQAEASSPRSLIIWVVAAFTLALVFLLTAFLCQHLTAFTQVVPLWLPAGVALGGCMLLGAGFLPFIVLASALFNVVYLNQASPDPLLHQWLVALVIGAGSALQAWVGSVLLKKTVGLELHLGGLRGVTQYALYAGLLSCLIAALVGVTVLELLGGSFRWSHWLGNVVTWWLGDSFGALVFTPVVLETARLRRASGDEIGRRLLLLVGLLSVVGLFTYFNYLVKYERQDAVELRMDQRASQLDDEFATVIETTNGVLAALRAYLQVEQRPQLEEFRLFALPLLEESGGFRALSWNPVVRHEELPEFLAWLRAQHGAELEVRGEPLYPDDPYVVVSMIEPLEQNRAALGFNVNSDLTRRTALRRADRTQHQVATELVKLVQGDHEVPGFLVFQPVYRRQPQPDQTWEDTLLGYATGVFDVPVLLDRVMQRTGLQGEVRARVFQVGHVEPVWGNYASWATLPILGAYQRQIDVEVFGTYWRVEISSELDALVGRFRASMLQTQLVELVLGVLLAVFILYFREQRELLEAEVLQRTGQLREVEHRFDMILDHAPQLISVSNPQREYVIANHAFRKAFDLDRMDHQVGNGDSGAFLGALEQSVRQSGESVQRGLQLKVDGERRNYQVFAFPLGKAADGTVGEVCFVATDLTDYLRAVNEMQVAMAESKAKSDFLAVMSHEIRTPLNGVLGAARLLADTQLDAGQRELLETVRKSGQALMNVIGNVLDYSKIAAGKVELDRVEFRLNELLEDCIEIARSSAEQEGTVLVLQVDPAIPAWLLGDEHHLRQVLLNLLSNAIKFTGQGEVALLVQLREARRGKVCKLRFAVRDSGIGMTDEQVARLFSSFSQADRSITRQYGGTGLGLAITKGLVELMGGRIDVESEVGLGTCFLVDLELDCVGRPAGYAGAGAQRVPAPVLDSENNMLQGLPILVAEDNNVNAMILVRTLESAGATVTRVGDGRQALDLYAGHGSEYALILMDCEMPEMDGFTASEEIRALEASQGRDRIPIIAQTAHVVPEYLQRCLDCGMNAYVTKPINHEELLEKIASILKLDEKAGR